MDDLMPWIMLALMVIGLFHCVRFVWHLPSRLLRMVRTRPEEQILEEMIRLNNEAVAAFRVLALAAPLVVLNAFLLTAEEYMGSPALLEEYAAQALHWAQSGGQGIDPQALEKFFKRMRESEYPAVHHSEVYNREYSPAYRVVAVQFLPSTWVRF